MLIKFQIFITFVLGQWQFFLFCIKSVVPHICCICMGLYMRVCLGVLFGVGVPPWVTRVCMIVSV